MKKLLASARLFGAFAIALAVVSLCPTSALGAPLATYQFGPGLTTFGMALPQGASTTGVKIGSLVTQSDVKTRWPDGSIRFVVVSANVPTAGTYVINAAAAATGTFTPTWPVISLDLVINNTTWTAPAGTFAGAMWLDGPVVREGRVRLAPTAGGVGHAQLEVLFDIRSYAAGGHRIDLTVQNVLDKVTMDKVAISSVALKVNGSAVWTHGAVTTYSMTRWRHVQWFGGTEATITPDFEPTYLAAALPRILPTVRNATYNFSGANYDLMGGAPPSGYPAVAYGEMNPDMAAGGGRAEIGALNWWEAQYLVHKTPNQRRAVLQNADLTGAWSNHLARADGAMIKLGDPGYDPAQWWWDPRAPAGNRPLAPLNPNTTWQGSREGVTSDTDTGRVGVASRYNEEHVPAPMYVAYLISGDRYYVDQAKYWATSAVLHSAPGWFLTDPVNFPGWKRGRNGATGNERILEFSGMTREFAWPLRLVGLAAWMLPDNDGLKTYLVETVQNNLNHVSEYYELWVKLGYGGALGSLGGAENASGWSLTRNGETTGRYTSPWRLAYTAYVVDWCTRQGLWTINGNVDAFVNRVASHAVAMNVQNPDFLNGKAGLSYNYYPVFNVMSGGRFTKWFDTFAEVKSYNESYQYTDGPPGNTIGWNPNSPQVGYYNAEHHMTLQIAIRRKLPNAELAAKRLEQVAGHGGDLNYRSGYAITFTGTSGTPPKPPANVRISS